MDADIIEAKKELDKDKEERDEMVAKKAGVSVA